MKAILLSLILTLSISSQATIHIVRVWDGYFQFVNDVGGGSDLTIELGDTVQWLPLDQPFMVHTITSTNIPDGAEAFDQIWQLPADTFFQYIPQVPGLYEYECTPHAVSFNMVGSITVNGGSTGIGEGLPVDNRVFAYPSPTNSWVQLRDDLISLPYSLYNLDGSIALSGISGKEIDLSGLAKGVYLLEVRGDRRYIQKIIRQ